MQVPIVLPEIGSVGEPIRLCGWLVEEGDFIVTGDVVVEVLIPGMTFNISANSTGRLVRIQKPVDSYVQTGEILGWIQTDQSDSDSSDVS